MRYISAQVILGTILCITASSHAAAQSVATKVMVRVTAHDAKIIGTGVGGARVTILNVENGDTLATGVQEGSTGDTQAIMVTARERGKVVYDTPGAAGFLAELILDGPTRVELVAEGPLGTPHAMQRASKTTLLIPGQDVLGDGIILDLQGFTVVFETPAKDVHVRAGEEFEIRANVTMLCGCPTQPGGLWDADQITVMARVLSNGDLVEEMSLEFAGTTSTFQGRIRVARTGRFEIQVIAMDAAKGNFGIVSQFLEVIK